MPLSRFLIFDCQNRKFLTLSAEPNEPRTVLLPLSRQKSTISEKQAG